MQKGKLQALAEAIRQTPHRDWCGPYDPAPGEDAPLFYMFCLAQQCGTGLVTAEDTLTCGNLWDLYTSNWKGDRDIFQKVSYERFCKFLQPDGATWRVSPARTLMRFFLHNSVAEACGCPLEDLDSNPAFATDPYKKRLNLLKNALYNRPERFVSKEGGPVIDYHVMRVFLRYFGFFLTGDALVDEAHVRDLAWNYAWDLHFHFQLTHDQTDQFLWKLGRSTCCYDGPKCGECPLADTCSKSEGREPRVETFFY